MIKSGRPQSIEIPVRNSNEVVEVFLDALPSNPSEIKSILREEAAPLELFLQFANEYYHQGKYDEFRYLVKEGVAECSRRGVSRKTGDVPLLTALASYHISMSLGIIGSSDVAGSDKDRDGESFREKHFQEATVLLNEAERYDQTSTFLLLRKGLLLLAQGKASLAEYQLRTIIQKEPDNMAALMALGTCLFVGKDWKGALSTFQEVLQKLPSIEESSLRMTITNCFVQLGFVEVACEAFQRLQILHPKDANILACLAVIMINRGPAHLAEGMTLLKEAYNIDRTNPTVLFHLGNHFFFKKDYSKATSLAQSALQYARNDEVKAAIHYLLGKIHHGQEHFNEAFIEYSEAIRHQPTHPLAQMGLAQVFLQRGDHSAAIECLHRISLNNNNELINNNDSEYWQIMGLLKATGSSAEDAKETLQRALSLRSTNSTSTELFSSFDLHISMASIHQESGNLSSAIASYDEAHIADPTRFKSSPEVSSNYAVLLHSAVGKSEEALGILDELLLHSSLNSELEAVIKFNKAKIFEDLGRLEEAEIIYKELNTAHHCLGMICVQRGMNTEAVEHFKEAIGIKEDDLDAWVLLASSHLRAKAITPARKAFERILKQIDRHEPFSLTALGNIHLEIARNEKRPAAVKECLKRSLEFYIKALSIDERNYCAANGVGSILAMRGRYAEAKDIFGQIKMNLTPSKSPLYMEVTLNWAHCQVELGQAQSALHAYESILPYLQKHGSRLASAHLHCARAAYIHGKNEKQPASLQTALKHLDAAEKILPNDLPIKFNKAICLQEMASLLIRQKGDMDIFSLGQESLSTAINIYESLSSSSIGKDAPNNNSNVVIGGVDERAVEERRRHCISLQQSFNSRIETIKAESSQRQAKLEAVRAQRQETMAAEAAKQAEIEAAKRIEDEKINAMRREMSEKINLHDIGEESEKSKRKRDSSRGQRANNNSRRRTNDASEEEEDKADNDDEDEEQMPITRRTRSKVSKLSAEYLSSDDDIDDTANDTVTM